jgi:hypothetical protein
MDPSLFRFRVLEVSNPLKHFGITNASASKPSARNAGRPMPAEKWAATSRNLDLRGSFEGIPVVCFRLAKFSKMRFKKL